MMFSKTSITLFISAVHSKDKQFEIKIITYFVYT